MITQLRLNPNLLKVPLYIAGKSVEEVQEEYGLDDVVKLATNENALGPSPLAVEAARQALGEAHRYPGIADRKLRQTWDRCPILILTSASSSPATARPTSSVCWRRRSSSTAAK